MGIIEPKNEETLQYLISIGIWKPSNNRQHMFKVINGKITDVLTIGEYMQKLLNGEI